jgi:hypothetical protein
MQLVEVENRERFLAKCEQERPEPLRCFGILPRLFG